ncbi:MAG: DM13 domain-containing protein [Parvibaculales bacterium]
MLKFINKSMLIGFVLGGLAALPVGFGLGTYYLPILVASEGASDAVVAAAKSGAMIKAEFRRDLKGSDGFHWGEGTLHLTREAGQYYFTLDGSVSPGPDYKLYLTPEYVEDEAEFLALKARSVRVADITGFDNFRVDVPMNIDPTQYPAVIIWCERFGEFITAGHLVKR